MISTKRSKITRQVVLGLTFVQRSNTAERFHDAWKSRVGFARNASSEGHRRQYRHLVRKSVAGAQVADWDIHNFATHHRRNLATNAQ
jgi:hypothetical protein